MGLAKTHWHALQAHAATNQQDHFILQEQKAIAGFVHNAQAQVQHAVMSQQAQTL